MPEINRDDIRVRDQDIQALASVDEIADFFTKLRYPEQFRMPVPPERLGFPQALRDSVQQLELITEIDDGMFKLQVYFIRLLSVTVAKTRELVRQFRDLNGEFLLILTDDFKHLDFVLLERGQPDLPGFNVAARTISVTPRQFTVNCQDPGRVAMRVLSRLTLTEFDDDGNPNVMFQYRKIKSAFTIADWSHPDFNNRALFSDYYLNQRLPQRDIWQAEDRNRTFREIRNLFARVKQVIQENGSNTPETFVKPVLEAMSARIMAGAEADYLLFTEDEQNPAAFILAYPWNRYLDGKDPERDKERGESNPGALVVKLLEIGVAPWGIVTNGKVWRLYSAKAHSRATNYYEVDLEETLGLAEPGVSFRYFYLFFRAAAFSTQSYPISGEVKEICFLDFLLEESEIYARELGERLKDQVFEQIFPHFAEGFIHSMGGPNALLELPEEDREEKLQMVFDATLIFLYRLLFVLYAESRDLLPDREVRGYYEISLQKIKEEIANKAGDNLTRAPEQIKSHFGIDSTTLYERLMRLFEVIDKGDPSTNVPVYNGGLFDTHPKPEDESYNAQMAKFLMEHKLPDQHLALGLDLLTRDVDPQLGLLGFVDYKSLGVRQLGSIYEGLLEFKVRIAPEKMAVVKGTRAEEILPYEEAKKEDRQILVVVRGRLAEERILTAGSVYLENDRRERKATGSYYTPDYIVKYIVQNTVGPVMDEKLKTLRPRMQKVDSEFREIIRHKKEVENVEKPDEFSILQNSFGDTLQQLFDIKILDPAMGSGHFLVEAVDYVTDRLVQFLDGFPFIATFFDGMKAAILEEMQDQRITINPDRLTDVTLLKRHVLKRCVYGVDINPMAVELAKLSLWLDCFTLGAPLSFLDHHLRCGNSLIGAMARDVEESFGENGQMSLLTGPFTGLLQAAQIMRGVSQITDVTAGQVRESSKLFHAFDEAAKPFKQLLDIFISKFFGVDLVEEFLSVFSQNEALDILVGNKEVTSGYSTLIDKSKKLYREINYFHWDLEFPEIFINLKNATWKENGGFDTIIGNPPYVAWSEIGNYRKLFEFGNYYNCDYSCRPNHEDAQPNLYLFFMILMHTLLNNGGYAGYIIPQEWLDDETAKDFTKCFVKNSEEIGLIIFQPNVHIFDESDEVIGTSSLLYFTNKSLNNRKLKKIYSFNVETDDIQEIHEILGAIKIWNQSSDKLFANLKFSYIPETRFDDLSWKVWLLGNISVFEKILNKRKKIIIRTGDKGYFTIGGGFQPPMDYVEFYSLSDSELMLIPKEERNFVYPAIINSSNITRYLLISENKNWIILNEINNYKKAQERTPILLGILEKNYDKLKKVFGNNWWKFPNIRNFDFFKNRYDKLLSPRTSNRNSFAYDNKGTLFKGTNSFIRINAPYSQMYLLALLNSKFLDKYYDLYGKGYHGESKKYEPGKIDHFPIRKINFVTSNGNRKNEFQKLISLLKESSESEFLHKIDSLLVPPHKSITGNINDLLTFGSDDVVHDILAYLASNMIVLFKDQKIIIENFWIDLNKSSSKEIYEGLHDHGKQERILSRDKNCSPFVDLESHMSCNLHEALGWNEEAFKAFAGMLIGSSNVIHEMVEIYRKYHLQYKALIEKIEETDNLIDQIVYRLYGLTEEEIEVVEQIE